MKQNEKGLRHGQNTNTQKTSLKQHQPSLCSIPSANIG